MSISLKADAGGTSGTIQINGVDRATVDASGISAGAGRRLAQIQTFQTGSMSTGLTQIPDDNTTPQSTEGDQYLSLAITPQNAGSTLEIDVLLHVSVNSGSSYAIAALFQDATANCLAAAKCIPTGVTGSQALAFKHVMTAGTTSATTFKVRAGPTTASALTVNGVNSVAYLNGTLASRITIKEYLP